MGCEHAVMEEDKVEVDVDNYHELLDGWRAALKKVKRPRKVVSGELKMS